MPPKYDILVVGNYTADLIFTGLHGLPEPGTETISPNFAMVPGEAYTSAVAMHRLGIKVAWSGDFGNDELSCWALREARREGLDESYFVHHKRSLRRTTVAFSYPQDRLFITYYDRDPLIQAGYKALLTVSSKAVFIPGLFYGSLFEQGLLWLRLRKIKLFMDGNSGSSNVSLKMPPVKKAIQATDIFLPNAREARMLTDKDDLEAALETLGDLCPLVIVKDGANGSYARQHGKTVHVSSIPVTPQDTTGAGDCFNAGFLKAYLDCQPVETCLKWGNIVGALSTQGLGGTGYKVTMVEVQEHNSNQITD